jgi:hypothetical protein
MNKLAVGVGLAACAMALPASAEIVDFSVGDNSFRLALYGPLSRVISDVKGQYDIGALMRPKRTDDLLITHIGAMITGDAGFAQANVAAGAGLRALYIGRDNKRGGALALGGQVEARYPGYDRIGLSVYGYGAPNVTTIGDVDRYYEIGIGLDYQIIKEASVYVGWRDVKTDIHDVGNVTADHSAHIGLRLHF